MWNHKLVVGRVSVDESSTPRHHSGAMLHRGGHYHVYSFCVHSVVNRSSHIVLKLTQMLLIDLIWLFSLGARIVVWNGAAVCFSVVVRVLCHVTHPSNRNQVYQRESYSVIVSASICRLVNLNKKLSSKISGVCKVLYKRVWVLMLPLEQGRSSALPVTTSTHPARLSTLIALVVELECWCACWVLLLHWTKNKTTKKNLRWLWDFDESRHVL